MNKALRWPPLHVAYIALCYHLTVAAGLAFDERNTLILIITGGLDKPVDWLGVEGTVVLLVVVSLSSLVGLSREHDWPSWIWPTALCLPQYFLVLIGSGQGVTILWSGEYEGVSRPFWLIVGGLALFEWVAVWHTIAIIRRIRYWMLILP